jgi:hypothetical protein
VGHVILAADDIVYGQFAYPAVCLSGPGRCRRGPTRCSDGSEAFQPLGRGRPIHTAISCAPLPAGHTCDANDNVVCDTPAMGPDERVELLLEAKRKYDAAGNGAAYDEVVDEVVGRVAGSGSIGKLDIGALVAWKRLRADTAWVKALMFLPDVDVRAQTARAVDAAQDGTQTVPEAASDARSALAGLPGMGVGDAIASTLCFVAAPNRMAVYDGRAHHGLALVGLQLDNRRGRYRHYMEFIEQCRGELAERSHSWTAREVDLALFQLGERARRTNTA